MQQSQPAPAPRWTREFLVYLVPVGALSAAQFAAYAQLLQTHARELPIRALTRPGGYAAELSPFRSFSWHSDGALRFRFAAAADARAESCDGADAHAWHRPVAVLGLCHCPATPSLRDAHAQFAATARRFPGALVHKCFVFEPQFTDDGGLEQVAALGSLVMFPAHHELEAGGSTVSLHLQVVMDTLAVTILMSLESTIRAAMRPQAALELGDGASFLLDTNVEPSRGQQQQQSVPLMQQAVGPGPPQSLHAAISSMASTAVSSTASALAAPFADSRSRKRQAARHRKLFGDYSVLLHCIPDALEHYAAALELLREEERKSGGASGDVLWLAAALEGYAYCLSLESRDQFAVEVIEKASEAAALYAKAGVNDLECQLVAKIGWHCVAVATQLEQAAVDTKSGGKEKVVEAIWVKRLLWDVIERGLAVFPDLHLQRQIEFVIEASRMLESVGHRRRMALFLHEASALLIARNHSSQSLGQPGTGRGATAAQSPGPPSSQRQKDLQAALLLERITAARLGITDDLSAPSNGRDWEVTTLYRSKKTRRGVQIDPSPMSAHEDAWLILRFHVLRQLLTISKMLGDPFLVGKYCIQLLQMLPRCDSLASSSAAKQTKSGGRKAATGRAPSSVDQVQQPFTALRGGAQGQPADRQGLFGKASAYFSPPSSIEIKTKRYFSLAASSSVTMSSAAASLSSTIASTPRILATPRQQFSAAVSAISTKASPAFASFSHHSSPHGFSNSTSTSNSSSASGGSPSVSGFEDVSSPGFGPGGGSHDSKFERLQSGGSDSSSNGTSNPTQSGSGGSVSSARGGTQERRFETLPVWNIRSKDDVVRMERNVLSVMESECSSLRASEQVKLPTFLGVERIRVLAKLEHPFVTKAVAMEKYSSLKNASDSAPGNSSEVKSDFFYSPFEKQTQAARRGGGNGDASAVDQQDNVFPVYEKIELEMVVSNPFGVPIEIQQATAWVVHEEDDDGTSATSESNGRRSSDSAVECYPCSLSLAPYEKRKSVILGIQPLREGAFRVRGCFLKVLSLKTTFEADAFAAFRVVGRLPLASVSLCEVGSLMHASPSPFEPAARERRENLRISMFSSETKRCELRIRNVGQNAINRCRLTATVLRRQVAKKSVVIFGNFHRSSSSPCSAVTSRRIGGLEIDHKLVQVLETDSITLRCTPLLYNGSDANESGSTLSMENGDSISLRFEVLLQKSGSHRYTSEHEPLEEEEEIVWSFVYADDPEISSVDASVDDVSPVVHYRETKLALQLVSLPSLKLSGVSLVPSTPESIPSAVALRSLVQGELIDSDRPMSFSAVLDNSHFLLVVEVENPTETAFRFRMRQRFQESTILDDDESDEASAFRCDVEIGRKCSRRLAIEIPRIHPHSPLFRASCDSDRVPVASVSSGMLSTRRTLASVLNSLVEMEWETHFGTKGTLRFEDHLWNSDDERNHSAMLLSSEFAFEIAVPEQFASSADPATLTRIDEDESAIPMLKADDSKLDAEKQSQSVSQSPFIFFYGTQLICERRQLAVRVLEFVPITIEIRRLWDHFAVRQEGAPSSEEECHASIEIRITQDGQEDDEDDSADGVSSVMGESVVVVGMLQRDLEWPGDHIDGADQTDDSVGAVQQQLRHEIQVLFLSCGEFRVSVCCRVVDAASNAAREIWSHQPLYLHATE